MYTYMPPLMSLPLTPGPTHLGHPEHRAELALLYYRFPLAIYFITGSIYIYINPNLPVHPTAPIFPLPHVCTSIFYIRISVSALLQGCFDDITVLTLYHASLHTLDYLRFVP